MFLTVSVVVTADVEYESEDEQVGCIWPLRSRYNFSSQTASLLSQFANQLQSALDLISITFQLNVIFHVFTVSLSNLLYICNVYVVYLNIYHLLYSRVCHVSVSVSAVCL